MRVGSNRAPLGGSTNWGSLSKAGKSRVIWAYAIVNPIPLIALNRLTNPANPNPNRMRGLRCSIPRRCLRIRRM